MPTKKCYIFAIGGTGARVLESFTYLLTAGCGYPKFKDWEFVPIMIDLDASNGNVVRCKEALDNYKYFEDVMQHIQGTENIFCKYKLTKMSTLSSYLLPIDLTHKNDLAAFIRYKDLNYQSVKRADGKEVTLGASRHLIDLLYSQHELMMQLNVGFKGHPNIGAVVLNQVTKKVEGTKETYLNPAFNEFVQNYTEGDRVFVISSIFGGMGASGFPHFMKVLEDLKQTDTKFGKMRVGTLSVMPYYKIDKNQHSYIDSNSFMTRTKAALQYYSREITNMNAAYYIGAPVVDRSYCNVEGGNAQKNPAHAVEFFAATSIFHFLNLDDEALNGSIKSNQHIYRFGVKDNNGWQITFAQLDDDATRKLVSVPLTYLYLLRQTLHIIDRNFDTKRPDYKSRYFTEVTWANNTGLAEIRHGSILSKPVYQLDFMNVPFYPRLKTFLDKYHSWLGEMGEENNDIILSFTPFVLHPDTGAEQLGQRGSTDLRNGILRGGISFSKDSIQYDAEITLHRSDRMEFKTLPSTRYFNIIIEIMNRIARDGANAKKFRDLYDNDSLKLDNNKKLANKFIELIYRSLIQIYSSI